MIAPGATIVGQQSLGFAAVIAACFLVNLMVGKTWFGPEFLVVKRNWNALAFWAVQAVLAIIALGLAVNGVLFLTGVRTP